MRAAKSLANLRPILDKDKSMSPGMKLAAGLKSADKKLQNEYIDGLQEEIKYLQYELKLLKDKDSLQNASLNQLQSFFNDGIPINENILALKNLFNSTKQGLEEKVRVNVAEMDKKVKVKSEIQAEITKIKLNLAKIQRERCQSNEAFVRQNVDLTQQLFFHRSRFEKLDAQNKQLQKRLRKLNEEIHALSRSSEKVNYANASKEELLKKEHLRVKSQNEQLQKEIIRLAHALEEIPNSTQENPEQVELTQACNELNRRIANCEKELSIQTSKNMELTYSIEQVQKERESEAEVKRELQRKINRVKRTISAENTMNEEDIVKRARELERNVISELQKRQQIINRNIIHVRGNAKLFEDQSNSIVEKKIDLTQALNDTKDARDSLSKQLAEVRQSVQALEADCVGLRKSNELFGRQLQPGSREVEHYRERVVFFLKEIARCKTELGNYEKQIELIQQLKSFNFEEMSLVKSTSEIMQKGILSFIKKCELIQSK